MFRTYFGDLRTGRLTRLPFLGYLLLLSVLFTLFGMGIAFGIGVAEYLIRGDLPAARDYLLEQVGLAAMLSLALFVLAVAIAKWNLITKRIRDMGLPGWWVLLIIVLADAALAWVMSASGEPLSRTYPIHAMISGLVTFGLLFIPSGLFSPKAPPEPIETKAAETELA